MRIMPFMKRKKGIQFAGIGIDSGGGDTSALANKTDLTAIILTGTTNTSGNVISAGTWFYLNGTPCVAKVDIASGATFTEDTNYEEKTVGSALSELNSNTTITELSITPSSGLLKVVRVGKIVNVMWDTGIESSTTIPTGNTIIARNLPRPYGLGASGQGSFPKDIIFANGTDAQSHPMITFAVDFNGNFSVFNMSGNSFGDSHSGVNIVYITID